MRPLRLKIKGLRSYRGELDLDLSDAGLFAIIGDTGAGKSSLLEAMTYALYSATTWDQRSVGALIADGVSTMSVSLDFSVDGQAYRVTRAKSRTSYPPPVHRLESLSDREYLPLDTESAVNAEIERLVGLRYDAFKSAVVLPQGRFDTLLRASPADRTAILKSILRLHELESVREAARSIGERVGQLVTAVEIQRASLLPDPEAERDRASAALAAAEAETARLQVLRQELAARATRRDEAVARERRALDDAAPVEEALRADVTTRYADLLENDAALGGLIADARLAAETTRQAEADATEAVTEAEQRGEGLAALTGHAATLRGLAAERPQLEEEIEAIRREDTGIKADTAALSALDASLIERRAAADAAGSDLVAAETNEDAARSMLQNAVSKLEAYRTLAAEVLAAVATCEERRAALEAGSATLGQLEAAERQAREGAERARERLNEARRQHSAAHAAAGIKPGDDCPVCGRRLPTTFSPPVAADLADAERAAGEAEAGQAEAIRLTQEARAAAAVMAEAFRVAEEARDSAETRADTARSAVAGLISQFDPELPDDELLIPVRSVLDEAVAARAEAKGEADRLAGDRSELEGEITSRRAALERRQVAVEEQRRRYASRQQALADRVESLPSDLQPLPETPLDLAPLVGEVEARLSAARILTDTRDRARLEHERDRETVQLLEERHRAEIERPRGRLRAACLLLRSSVGRVVDATKLPDELEESADLAAEAVWARTLEGVANHALAELGRTAESARADSEAARAEHEALLTAAGYTGEAELDKAGRVATGDERLAKEALARAERELPQAVELDRRLQEGVAFRDALRELASLLTDGTFIGHVVAQRQQALLGVSSEILASVSEGRYGFADDFQIVDRQTGQARSSRTLSGGETFQASLSLALGLVELAGRSGGRLDALFLDEGFGALDANALQDALAELERRASGGRLIAVISHIRAVAEGIEHVLLVTRGSTGSEARWISRSERDAEVEREVDASLLA